MIYEVGGKDCRVYRLDRFVRIEVPLGDSFIDLTTDEAVEMAEAIIEEAD